MLSGFFCNPGISEFVEGVGELSKNWLPINIFLESRISSVRFFLGSPLGNKLVTAFWIFSSLLA